MTDKLFTGNETFTYSLSIPPNKTILDFWAWNSTDLLDNTLRGALAEFIVATALGVELVSPRVSWAEYDLDANIEGDNIKVEVKSSAYLQSWYQNKLSKIRFGCGPSQAFVNQDFDGIKIRHSDVYVFSLFECKDREIADTMNLDQWVFYIISTETLNEKIGTQKTISLTSLLRLNPIEARYHKIHDAVKIVFHGDIASLPDS